MSAAARPSPSARACRAGLAVLALGAAVACTKKAEQAPAEVAPFATMPAPAESAVATPNYMKDHVAMDAALAQALVGQWSEREVIDGAAVEAIVTYGADRTMSAAMLGKNGERLKPATGTWAVQQGFLTFTLTLDGKPQSGADEILRIDASQFVYVDGEDKKTKIATRLPADALAGAAATPAQPAPPPAIQAAAAPAADGTLFADESLFVAKEDVQVQILRLTETAQIRLVLELEEKVPITVVFQRGRVSPEDYTIGLGMLIASPWLAALGNDMGKSSTINDLFTSRLSKRAAYGGFTSPWVTLSPGTYTVILDNSGELSPGRGDAPARLRAYKRPVP